MTEPPVIYGPNGKPIRGEVLPPDPGVIPQTASVRPVTAAEARSLVDKSMAQEASPMGQEVAKRVRSQGTSVTSVWDPRRGKPKPTPVTWETLRLMSNRNEWVSAIVKTRKNQLGKVKWNIVPKDPDDQSSSTKQVVDRVTKLLRRPSMHGSEPHSRSWRQFIGEVLEDLLVLDAGCIEKERDATGWIVALYPVDGATIRPNIDQKGGYADDAYVQLVDGQVTARFGMEDLVYIMDNPQTDVRFAGYGFSPLEKLIVSVTADLYASKYNMSYFEKGAVPEGLLNLGEDVPPEDVDAFRLYWMNEIMGKPWALPIVGGKGVEWIQWRDNNRDMQFMEYQSWLLKKLCAVYQIPPQEVGELEDVNRSTADDQDEVNESKSLEPILSLLSDYIEVEIIGPHGLGLGDWVEFQWEQEGDNEAQIINRFQVMIPIGAATRSEFRDAMGMEAADEDTPGAEGLDAYLADGEPKPLPSKEDLAVMGAAAQQKREEEQAQQQAMGAQGPGSMPWKPGNANDPDVQDSMRQHAASGGDIGARQPPHLEPGAVGKSEPEGRDRNPAMTAEVDDMTAIFATKQRELVDGLASILDVPVGDVEELV